jgi:hypothetical protein
VGNRAGLRGRVAGNVHRYRHLHLVTDQETEKAQVCIYIARVDTCLLEIFTIHY